MNKIQRIYIVIMIFFINIFSIISLCFIININKQLEDSIIKLKNITEDMKEINKTIDSIEQKINVIEKDTNEFEEYINKTLDEHEEKLNNANELLDAAENFQ